MSVWNFLTGLVKPITDLVDEVHTSDEEKMMIKAQIMRIQSEAAAKMQEYETALLEARSNIVVSEAKGESWLQRSWRPIAMLTFLALSVLDALGFLPNPLAPQAWTLMQIGLGGYVIGRSFEKNATGRVKEIKKQFSEYIRNGK